MIQNDAGHSLAEFRLPRAKDRLRWGMPSNRKRFDDPTPLGGYDQVLNRVGIQYWRMASTAPGMSL
jgi:hypothetical protein